MAESKDSKIKKMELDISQVTRTTSLLNSNQIQKLFNSTPKKYKYDRPGKGGKNWTYIRVSYVRRVLDSVFGFNWSFDIDTTLSEAFDVAEMTNYCVVKGVLVAKVKDDGVWIDLRKTQFGRAEVKWTTDKSGKRVPLDFGNDMKAAASDCLKKCASLLGVGADVYEAEEFVEIEIVGSDENTNAKKATAKKLREAQAVLESGSESVGKQNA